MTAPAITALFLMTSGVCLYIYNDLTFSWDGFLLNFADVLIGIANTLMQVPPASSHLLPPTWLPPSQLHQPNDTTQLPATQLHHGLPPPQLPANPTPPATPTSAPDCAPSRLI